MRTCTSHTYSPPVHDYRSPAAWVSRCRRVAPSLQMPVTHLQIVPRVYSNMCHHTIYSSSISKTGLPYWSLQRNEIVQAHHRVASAMHHCPADNLIIWNSQQPNNQSRWSVLAFASSSAINNTSDVNPAHIDIAPYWETFNSLPIISWCTINTLWGILIVGDSKR